MHTLETATSTTSTANAAAYQSTHVESCSGKILKGGAYASCTLLTGVVGYLLITGAINMHDAISAGFPADRIVVAGVVGATAAASFILGCCSDKFAASKKLEENVKRLELGVTGLRQENSELERNCIQLGLLVESLKEERFNYVEKLAETQVKLDEEIENFEKAEKKLAGVKADLADLNKTVVDQNKIISDLNNKNKALKKTAEKVAKENQVLQRENGDIHVLIDRFTNENGVFSEKTEELTEKNEQFVAAINFLKSQLSEMQEENHHIRNERNELSKKMVQLDTLNTALNKDLDALRESEKKQKEIIDNINLVIGNIAGLEELEKHLKPLIDVLQDSP